MTPPAQAPLGSIPPEIACAQDYETLAPNFMALPHHAYVAGGSGLDITVGANQAAFARWAIYPRLLRDVKVGHPRSEIGGEQYAHPIFLAPVAFQKLAHPAAELDTARAAYAMEACMVSSTLSSATLEDIARTGGPQRWFQLYFQARREDTLALTERAAQAGYRALVVTLDAAVQVPSQRALRAGFRMPADCVAANLRGHGVVERAERAAHESRIFQGVMLDAPTWDDLAWLMRTTRLPLWIKGVLHPDDARALKDLGVAGLIVSNHGGRSLDGAPASLDALPAVRAAVGRDVPVLLDSGIRSGADVFKALALGANAVLVGRLQMYALSVAGALGVAHMLKLLREELEVCMAQAGCASLGEIGAHALCPVPGAVEFPC